MSEVQEQPLIRREGVHRLLVTGGDDELLSFSMAVCLIANPTEQRGQTILFTVFADDLDYVIYCARNAGVTVQQREDTDVQPFWRLVVRGAAAPWEPTEGKQ